MYKELATCVGTVNFGFNSTTGTNFKLLKQAVQYTYRANKAKRDGQMK